MIKSSLVALSYYCSKNEIKKSEQNLKKLGFKAQNFISREKFLDKWAGSPKKRTELFKKAWQSDSKVIFSCKGGSGIFHVLPSIKWNLIRKKRKLMVGYSDVTPLLNLIYEKANLITLHGPNTIKDLDKNSFEALKNALKMENYGIRFSNKQVWRGSKLKEIKGTIVGGNLERLKDLFAFYPKTDFKNKIVFFEEVDQSEHQIFHLLWFLKHSKNFKPKAILVGNLNLKKDKEVFGILDSLFSDVPIITNLPFSHKLPNITVPIGADCKIDLERKTIDFLFSEKDREYSIKF